VGTRHVEHHYNIPRLNKVFAASSAALFLSIIGLVWWDYSRPWKRYQRQFAALELERTREAMDAALSEEQRKELEALGQKLAAARAEFEERARDPAYQRDEARVKELEAREFVLDQTARQIKSVIDSRRFYYEETLKDRGPRAARALGEELARLEQERNETLDQLKSTQAELKEAQDALAIWTKRQDERQAAIATLTKDRDLLAKKARHLEPNWITKTRNAVILDMLQPTEKPRQIVTTKILDDWVFEKANKVDRCTTCHLAIDQEGYESYPNPFRSHPNLDLFLSSKSPHKMDDVGCTVCHQGRGWATEFQRVTHSPDSEEQRHAWEAAYGWHHDHWWEQPMFPKGYSEAGCYPCHQEQLQIGNFPHRDAAGDLLEERQPAAPLLDQGLKLVWEYGCTGCHKIESLSDPADADPGLRDFRKVGPDLSHVAQKLDERFINKWLQNPKHFRPTTRMPRIFGLENHDTPELRARERAEINSVAYFLLARSKPLAGVRRPSGPGNAQMGRQLTGSIGCVACHTIPGIEPQAGKEEFKATFGPDLGAIGSKVSYEWLYAWVLDPEHYFEETRMPSLRLTEEEARDVATFLSTLRNETFEREEPVAYDPQVLDRITQEYLLANVTVEQAKRTIAGMSTEEKKLLVGEKIVNRYGCHGCHTIPGLETARQIGTELTEEGSKDVERLDFGFLGEQPPYLEPTNHAWFLQKLKEPRSFDRGKDKAREDLLRMPQFDFTDEQAKAITTVLLSLRKTDTIPVSSRKRLDPREKAIERGRRLLMKHHCQACHSIDGRGGETIQAYLPPTANAPPPIDGAGRKLQSAWLFPFLKSPTPLRVISVRMPTFAFTDAEINALMHYFAAIWNEPFPFDSEAAGTLDAEAEAQTREMFEVAKCQSCHVTTDTPRPEEGQKTAPNLLLTKHRLKSRWVLDWLSDPQSLQANTAMPTFWDEGEPIPALQDFFEGEGEKQIKAMRDYLYTLREEGVVPRAQR
jgi:mono/diheme cytochrome c family protein